MGLETVSQLEEKLVAKALNVTPYDTVFDAECGAANPTFYTREIFFPGRVKSPYLPGKKAIESNWGRISTFDNWMPAKIRQGCQRGAISECGAL